DLERHPRIVSFAVAGRALDDRFVPGDARLLRGLRDAIDVRAEGNDRLARSPSRGPCRRDAGNALLDREAVLPEDRGQVLRRLEFLEAELAEAEYRVVPFLDVFLKRIDLEPDVALVLIQLRARRGGRLLRRRRIQGNGSDDSNRQRRPSNGVHQRLPPSFAPSLCELRRRQPAPSSRPVAPAHPAPPAHPTFARPSLSALRRASPPYCCCADDFAGLTVVGYLMPS